MAQVYLCVSYELFKAPKPTQGDKMYQREPPKSEPHFVVDKVGYVFVPDEKSRCKVSPELIGRNAMIEIKIKNKITQQKIKLSQRFADKVNHLLNVVDPSITYHIFMKDYEGIFGSTNTGKVVQIFSDLGEITLYYHKIQSFKKDMMSQAFNANYIAYIDHVFLEHENPCISNIQFKKALAFVFTNRSSLIK